MNVFDEIIRQTKLLFADGNPRVYLYNPNNTGTEGKKNELVLSREAAYELGEGSLPSVTFTAITDNEQLIPSDRILLFGKDLQELRDDSPFARITILLTDNIEENGDLGAYAIIKNIELKKYNVYPQGYMMRTSAFSNREQVRISKGALKAGLSFEQVGNLYIRKYKENNHVKAATVIFVTLPDAPYAELERLADNCVEITNALNHMLTDIDINCHACEWKPVCNEVEGMKEMHFKMAGH